MAQDETDIEELSAFMNALADKILPLIAEKLFGVDIVPPLPKIEDYTPEGRRKRQLKALKRSIQRKRKLSAEDMLDIYVLHEEKQVSFRSIGKQFRVSEWTIRKTFQKVEKALTKANLQYRPCFPEGW